MKSIRIGLRAGRKHDQIDIFACNIISVDIGVALDLDLKFLKLAFIPPQQIQDLCSSRLQAGKTELATKLGCRFLEGSPDALAPPPRALPPTLRVRHRPPEHGEACQLVKNDPPAMSLLAQPTGSPRHEIQ